MMQTLTKLMTEIESSSIIFGNFNISLSIFGRTPTEKINNKIEDMKYHYKSFISGRYRTCYARTAKHKFSSSACEIFSRIHLI